MSRKKTQNKTNIILERIQAHYHLINDEAVALFYGVSESTISAWRTRNRINKTLIRAKCNDENLANWFFNGIKTHDSQPDGRPVDYTSLIMETLSPYLSSNKSALSALTPDAQDALRYTIKAFEILNSGTDYAGALRDNIMCFLKAVEDEKRIHRLEDEMSSLKKQLLASGTLPSK